METPAPQRRREPPGLERLAIHRHREGCWERCEDAVAVEEPLEIRIGGRPVAVTMRTPGHDAELVAGFLLAEGVVRRATEIRHLRACGDGDEGTRLDATLAPGVAFDPTRLTRHVFVSSSCGLCGVAALEQVRRNFAPIEPAPLPAPAVLAQAMERLRAGQSLFGATGGLHAAGLFRLDGELLAVREDIGRHNAVDKVLGHALRQDRIPARGTMLLVSGRASFEIVQKALAAGVPVVAAVSAPSSLAVALARESGMGLAGFVRPGRMNVYAGQPEG